MLTGKMPIRPGLRTHIVLIFHIKQFTPMSTTAEKLYLRDAMRANDFMHEPSDIHHLNSVAASNLAIGGRASEILVERQCRTR